MQFLGPKPNGMYVLLSLFAFSFALNLHTVVVYYNERGMANYLSGMNCSGSGQYLGLW